MLIWEVARELQDATPEEMTFVVLPGWRMEEIAASLPTSGIFKMGVREGKMCLLRSLPEIQADECRWARFAELYHWVI